MEIVLSKDLISVVLPRLWGFHTLMSAVGSIFDTMRGSGCSEACEQIYATNSVPNILSGHAIARALRCLHLLDAALHVKLLQQIIDKCTEDECGFTSSDLEKLRKIVTSVDNEEEDHDVMEDIKSESLTRLNDQLQGLKSDLAVCRTPRLWLQFLDYIDIIHQFIAAERLRNWNLHLESCSILLNLFAATGHHHYAESCRL